MCAGLVELQRAIKSYATGFDAGALSCEAAGEVVSLCARIESSVGAVKALAAARVAEGETWKSEGFRSAGAQLAALSGVSSGAARATLDTGRRLSFQGEVARAALSGGLSVSQAALVAHGAEADPDKTSELLEKARCLSISELKDEVACIKAAVSDQEERHKRIHAARRLRSWTDLEGMWHLGAQGLPEDGARTHSVIATIRRALTLSRRERGIVGETFEALDYDAVMALIEIALGTNSELSLADLHHHGLFPALDDLADLLEDPNNPNNFDPAEAADPSCGGGSQERSLCLFDEPASEDAPPEQRNGGPPGPADQPAPAKQHKTGRRRRRRGALTTQMQVRVDLDALLGGVPVEGELCEIVGYGPVPVSVIEDLLANDNTFVVAALTKAKQTVGVYHSGRHPTAYQKSALSFFYPACAVQGCNAKAFLQNDHREDWAKTHYTVYDLMDRLCSFHHRLKTTKGWALVHGSGKRRFVPPDHPDHPRNRGPTESPTGHTCTKAD